MCWKAPSRAASADLPVAFMRSTSRRPELHQIPNKLADLQIAGIAAAYGLGLATRNVGDFAGLGLVLVDPWRPDV
jgi:predicted nucleic acid-binding protein